MLGNPKDNDSPCLQESHVAGRHPSGLHSPAWPTLSRWRSETRTRKLKAPPCRVGLLRFRLDLGEVAGSRMMTHEVRIQISECRSQNEEEEGQRTRGGPSVPRLSGCRFHVRPRAAASAVAVLKLRVRRQGQSVSLKPHEGVPTARFRCRETESAHSADEVATLAGRPARHARPSWGAASGRG